MIAFRSFRNSDPPHLVRIWNAQTEPHSLVKPLTITRFEQLVLSRIYFRPEDLLIAEDDGCPIGFVHVGFGPTADGSKLDLSCGVISNLMVAPALVEADVDAKLLQRGEDHLRVAGAVNIAAGGLYPIDPFYWGLMGGTLSTGISATDKLRTAFWQAQGYSEDRKFAVWERSLTGFRPPVDRFQLQIKRKCGVNIGHELPFHSWWEAAVFNQVDRSQFILQTSANHAVQAALTFWDMQHLTQSHARRTIGLLTADVLPASFSNGQVTFLLADAMRQMQAVGITHLEIAVADGDNDWPPVLTTLGYTLVEERATWKKAVY